MRKKSINIDHCIKTLHKVANTEDKTSGHYNLLKDAAIKLGFIKLAVKKLDQTIAQLETILK